MVESTYNRVFFCYFSSQQIMYFFFFLSGSMQPWIALQFTAGEYSSGNLLSLMKRIIEAGEEKNPKSHSVRSLVLSSKENENLKCSHDSEGFTLSFKPFIKVGNVRGFQMKTWSAFTDAKE